MRPIGEEQAAPWSNPQDMAAGKVARPAFVALVATALFAMAFPSLAARSTASRSRDAQTTTVTAAGGPYAFLWEWSPAEVTIAKGDRVTWENPTSATHHVTAWDGAWKVQKHVEVGGAITLRFKKPGVYRYWCDVSTHADIVYVGEERICVGMCGVITVE